MDSQIEVDHYIVLGLPSGEQGSKLTVQEITTAYKQKAIELHPDKCPNDPNANANFQKLNSSYQILKDETSRKLFDDHLSLHQSLKDRFWEVFEDRLRQRRRQTRYPLKREMIFEVDEREVKKLRSVRISNVLNFVRGR